MAKKPQTTTLKRGRGRPRKEQTIAVDGDEQEPITDFRTHVAESNGDEGSSEEPDLADPSLFSEMDQQRIPKLEKKGREWVRQDDLAKKETEKSKGLAEECILIMRDHNIDRYSHGDLHLVIKPGKVKLEGEIG